MYIESADRLKEAKDVTITCVALGHTLPFGRVDGI
jgi:hypothetical protein